MAGLLNTKVANVVTHSAILKSLKLPSQMDRVDSDGRSDFSHRETLLKTAVKKFNHLMEPVRRLSLNFFDVSSRDL